MLSEILPLGKTRHFFFNENKARMKSNMACVRASFSARWPGYCGRREGCVSPLFGPQQIFHGCPVLVLVTIPISEKCRATVVATQVVADAITALRHLCDFCCIVANQFMRVWQTGYEQSAVGEALFYCVSRVVEDWVILFCLVARS